MNEIKVESPPKRPNLIQRLSRWYLLLLIGWFVLFLLFGDGNGYLGLVNSVAIFLFVPLPLVTFLANRWHDSKMLLASLFGLGLFLALWGPLLWPQTGDDLKGPSLRVMTFNVLGKLGDPDKVIASIESEDADVVFLQEVTGDYGTELRQTLKQQYPYQILDPGTRSAGMAVFSRFPIERIDIVLDGTWRGDPQILQMDWNGQPITLVNFHTVSTGAIWPRWVRFTYAQREESVAELARFAEDAMQHGPVIVAGDANATRLNDAYQTLNAVLNDAWWESGWGMGHTFPASIEPDNLLTRVSFFLIPHWLVRIDHIFYSDHWQASRTWLADFSGGSDHRGVVTELFLVGN